MDMDSSLIKDLIPPDTLKVLWNPLIINSKTNFETSEWFFSNELHRPNYIGKIKKGVTVSSNRRKSFEVGN